MGGPLDGRHCVFGMDCKSGPYRHGGGISAQRKLLMPYLKAAFDAKMPAILTPHTTLFLAHFQNDAGMLGALYLYQQRRQEAGKRI